MQSEICTTHYYAYNETLAAIQMVKKYIQDHHCVLYGGQSIDYALRLKGLQLYEDWQLPDLDFQTDDYANDAYELFRIIGTALSSRINISVINALHHTTLRIQVGKMSVGDITYVPNRILKMYKKSALMYEGCLVRHPFFQYIDIHRSFSYPYENTMLEVITNRWKKDFERFLLMTEYYNPGDKTLIGSFIKKYDLKTESKLGRLGLKKDKSNADTKKEKVAQAADPDEVIRLYKNMGPDFIVKPVSMIGLINGELAFLLYLYIYKSVRGKSGNSQFLINKDDDLFYTGSAYFLNSYLTINADKESFFLQHPDMMKQIKVTNPYMDLMPSRIVCEDWELIDIDHKTGYHDIDLFAINPKWPKIIVRVVSINFLILYVSMLWITLRTNVYLSMYLKLLRMVKRVYEIPDESHTKLTKLLFPSIYVYGEEKPHIFELRKDEFSKPTNIYINKYNSLEQALSEIKTFEYHDVYNIDGL